MDHIKEFHIKHGCYINIKPLEGDIGCEVHFPSNRFDNIPYVVKKYILSADPYMIELYTKVSDKDPVYKDIYVVGSNIRLLVLQDIFITANNLGISKDLIVVEGGGKLFDLLKLPQTREERELETQLCVRFRELLAGNVAASDIEGYEQVLFCFENGGL